MGSKGERERERKKKKSEISRWNINLLPECITIDPRANKAVVCKDSWWLNCFMDFKIVLIPSIDAIRSELWACPYDKWARAKHAVTWSDESIENEFMLVRISLNISFRCSSNVIPENANDPSVPHAAKNWVGIIRMKRQERE